MKPVRQNLLFSKSSRCCGLVTLALTLAWPAHGAVLDLIGQWPGCRRGWANGVALSGTYAYVVDALAGLQVINVSNPADPSGWAVTTPAGLPRAWR
jgi:hypothetical protein